MGHIQLAEENKKAGCLATIISAFTKSNAVPEEYNEKSGFASYSDEESPYQQMSHLDVSINNCDRIIKKKIDSISKELREISLDLHENWEPSMKEFHAVEVVTNYLEKQGFKVTRGVYGLETAFMAEFSRGEGRRVGLCSEYDGLPGLGQGCGHNLICISGIATAMAVKASLESGKISGKVILFGTPAEERAIGKIVLSDKKAFADNVDVCLMLHPSPFDGQYAPFLACHDVEVEFFGRASHASASPWEGVNALDALVQVWNGISMLRQQILPTDRIHGIVTNGGQAPNIIPEYTSALLFIRATKVQRIYELMKKLENIFEAAGIATGCRVKFTWREVGVCMDVIQNRPMADFYAKKMKKKGIHFPSEEDQIRTAGGSTDMGNVSYQVPVIHPMYRIPTTASNHTAGFTEAAKTVEAHTATLNAAECLASTAVEILRNDSFYTNVLSNFQQSVMADQVNNYCRYV